MVSFDVSSLFTKVPVDEALSIVQQKLEQDTSLTERTSLEVPSIMGLLRFCFQTTYFVYGDRLYQQQEGAAMGSPLSPILANIFMEFFEESALELTDSRPSFWLRYVDDTFVIWPHGLESLHLFLQFLNSIRPSINFTMELEKEDKLPFLDVLVTRNRLTQTLHTSVYRKPTHTDRYLHYRSYHSPTIKNGIIKTLLHRSTTICCDRESRKQEVAHIFSVFLHNGYPPHFIRRVLWRQAHTRTPVQQDPLTTITIPYISGVSERIRRVCANYRIRVFFRSNRTLRSLLTKVRPCAHPVKSTGLIYRIPCLDCDSSYIGETGRTLDTRLSEHRRNCRNGEVLKSGVAQHALVDNHRINWDGSTVINREQHWYRRRVKEALYIRRFGNFNLDRGLDISSIWNDNITSL